MSGRTLSKFLAAPLALLGLAALSGGAGATPQMGDYVAVPPTIMQSADPNVMFNLSVETPMQGAAYNDQPDGASCGGRVNDGGTVGVCYFATQEYIGYFDPDKCYTYSSGNSRFEPAGATGANHTCSGQWSGNFLNWATMTAIDEFRWALTGGNRVTDTTSATVLQRANMGLSQGHDWYPVKLVSATRNVAPSTVTPYSDSKIYIYNHGYQVDFGTSWGSGNRAANLWVRPKVCDAAAGLEDNCTAYGDHSKPEGLIQANATKMRFALMSYTRDNDKTRDGGVLRANMKYVGPLRPASGGGVESNPNAEWDSDGIFTFNPDGVTIGSGVANSGVINYLNQFGASGYKSYDPIGELFYECINYFKNRGPTAEYYSGLTDSEKDGFPVITNWTDPIQHACQKNFIVGINDANPWLDKQLPGSPITSSQYPGTSYSVGSASGGNDTSDRGNPSNSDPAINVLSLTNTVGDLQGITGTSQCVGCVPGNCNFSASNKTITELGKAFGTCPWPPKENSYHIAGLAYYARAFDLRSDFSGDQTVSTFMVDTQEYSATPLTGQMNMLWLAGKYGGFKEQDHTDSNGDGNSNEPNLTAEWDADGDGEPDNFVLATDPLKLVNGLQRAFADIQERVSSATAASVIANSYTGAGAVFQALYQPKVAVGSKQITWAGTLHALFIDASSQLREDGDGDGVLDDCTVDPVVEVFYDSAANLTKLRRYATGADCDTDAVGVTSSVLPLESLRPIWNARDQLALHSNASLALNRLYSATADTGRYLMTSVDGGNSVPFQASQFTTAGNYAMLQAADATEAAAIIAYIRGDDSNAAYRSRTIDYDGDGSDEVWRLGDIVHSTPVAVGVPGDAYGTRFDEKYNDTTYAAFRARYENRRQVVYVGANDGLLHAFNGGFWNEQSRAFQTSPAGQAAHPLGAELWAYAPFNLLPHLKWLSDPLYAHVYYMDATPLVFDARIFTPDNDHPGGWGTVLVAGMRLGGGPLDRDGDGAPETRSAYVILDVTNPEVPPTLMAELSHAELGFTTSEPGVAVRRAASLDNDWGNPSLNQWYLVFGSGPTALDSATSNQNARLFVYDLVARAFVTGYGPYDLQGAVTGGDAGAGVLTSFVGAVNAVDWGNDYHRDVVYFGTDGVDGLNPAGRLMRLVMSDYAVDWEVSTLMNPGQPFTTRPQGSRDVQGNRWVLVGSGRLWVQGDKATTGQHAFYGIKEPLDAGGNPTWATLATADLQDVTGVQVFTNGSIMDTGGVFLPEVVTTFNGMVEIIAAHDGWVRAFPAPGGSPSTRTFTEALIYGELLSFTDYTPPGDVCEAEGSSDLYALLFTTGTAFISPVLGTNPSADGELSLGQITLGKGVASAPVLHRGTELGPGQATLLVQTSTGAITQTGLTLPTPSGGRLSWREIFDY